VLLVVTTGRLPAETQARVPDGLPAGPFFVAPYFETGIEYDSNIFRLSEPDPNVPNSPEPQGDEIALLRGGALATMPFRNSEFILGWEGEYRDYRTFQFPRRLAQQFGAEVELNFASTDQLRIAERYIQGVTDVQTVDPGGERTFTGQPYNYNRFEVEASRNETGHPGYAVSIARVDLEYVDAVGRDLFFDYSGYDASVEYRHPLAGSKWLVAYYDLQRFDHFRDCLSRPDVGTTCNLNAGGEIQGVAYGPNEPYRKQISDTLQFGLRGFLARRQPFFVRVGVGNFAYDRQDDLPDTSFVGVMGAARFRLALGSKTFLDLRAQRTPLPSNFETYYIINELRVDVERRWLRRSLYGFRALVSRNGYGDGDPRVDGRTDRRRVLEGFMDWFFHRRASLRFSAGHYRRRSNVQIADYNANVVTAGIRYGY